jgi:iron complex outermembrane receptor protein
VVDQYTSSIATQQGLNVSDTIGFSRQWSLKLALSQDWMQTQNYGKTGVATTSYNKNGLSPMPSLIYKPRENVTTYLTYASSLQQGDIAPGTAGVTNANVALAPYRSTQYEGGIKATVAKIDLAFAVFRLERPFANLVATGPGVTTFEISGQQINKGFEASAVGKATENLNIVSGITVLDPILDATGVAATNDKQYVGIPKFKSNILFEYSVPPVQGLVGTLDWQYTARRPGNDSNTTWAPSYSVFDVGARYTTRVCNKQTTLRVAVNNVTDEHYWSTVGPSDLTGTNAGNMTAHLGAPRTVAASMSVNF